MSCCVFFGTADTLASDISCCIFGVAKGLLQLVVSGVGVGLVSGHSGSYLLVSGMVAVAVAVAQMIQWRQGECNRYRYGRQLHRLRHCYRRTIPLRSRSKGRRDPWIFVFFF